jgi:hexosaminidase
LDFASDGRAQNFTPSMLEILQTAQDGFNRSLGRGIPSNRDKYPINPDNLEVAVMSGIRIQIDTLTSKLDPVADESYRIHIPHPSDSSWIDLHSVTVYGARHGLETIKQLLKFAWIEPTATGEPTAVFGIHNTPLYIEDGPAYAYRGLMIDTARHYLPLTLILQNLELMAAHKLNVLHWHVTDSQSWPYQSAAFPELSARGAYCEACVYTRSDVDAVVRQAAALGIRVIAEFDLPGHSQGKCSCRMGMSVFLHECLIPVVGLNLAYTPSICIAAIGQSHPELLSTNWRGEPSEPLDVTEPAVHNFVNRLYDEIAQVFPDDWIHIGGDEGTTRYLFGWTWCCDGTWIL